ncbi:hypothetical protein UK82_06285 [Frankia sp. ACN1ag]|nr:hypothetical protein UK82_06285 [Frankia sp. ACN1ag]
MRDVGDEADRTGRRLNDVSDSGRGFPELNARLAGMAEGMRSAAERSAGLAVTMGTTAVKLLAGAQAAAQIGSTLAQAGAGAGVLAPALLTGAQALGTLKLVSDEAGRQLKQLQPQFDGIKKAAEGAFGPQFNVAVKTFASNLPVVREGVRQTAKVFGDLSVTAAKVFSGPAFRKDLADIMTANAAATANLGFAGLDMAEAFFDVAVAAKAVWVGLTRNLNVGADSIAQWVAAKRASGELTAAIQNGANTIGNIVTSLWNFGVGVKALFSAISADGVNLSDNLLTMSQRFRDWATSAQVTGTVTALFQGLRTAASLARTAISDAATEVATGFANGEVAPGLTGLAGGFQELGVRARALVDLARNDLWPTLVSVAQVVNDQLLPAFQGISSTVFQVTTGALASLLRIARDDLVPVFRDQVAPILREDVVPAVQALGNWITTTLLPAVESLAAALAGRLGQALSGVLDALRQNEPQLKVFGQALLDIATVIVKVVEFALKNNLGGAMIAVGLAIRATIDIIGAYVTASLRLAAVALEVAGTVITAFRGIFDGVLTSVTGIISTMARLPGPLGAPWRSAQDAVTGFRTRVDADLTTAENRVNTAKSNINNWLAGINDKTVTITVKERRELDYYSNTSPNAPGLTYYASGGRPRPGEWSVVGENGPELVRWAASAQVFSNAASARMLSAGRTLPTYNPAPQLSDRYGAGATIVNVTVNAPVSGSVTTERDLAESIAGRVRDTIATRISGSNGRRSGL